MNGPAAMPRPMIRPSAGRAGQMVAAAKVATAGGASSTPMVARSGSGIGARNSVFGTRNASAAQPAMPTEQPIARWQATAAHRLRRLRQSTDSRWRVAMRPPIRIARPESQTIRPAGAQARKAHARLAKRREWKAKADLHPARWFAKNSWKKRNAHQKEKHYKEDAYAQEKQHRLTVKHDGKESAVSCRSALYNEPSMTLSASFLILLACIHSACAIGPSFHPIPLCGECHVPYSRTVFRDDARRRGSADDGDARDGKQHQVRHGKAV